MVNVRFYTTGLVLLALFFGCVPEPKKPVESLNENQKAMILRGERVGDYYYGDMERLEILKAPVVVVSKSKHVFSNNTVVVRDDLGEMAILQDEIWDSVSVGDIIKK